MYLDSSKALVLRWDFKTTYPAVMDSAVEAGLVSDADTDQKCVVALHEEHRSHALALLCEIDSVAAARRSGIDRLTGRPPRTDKQREALAKLYAEQPARLQHAFDVLMDVYAEVFGDDASDEFRKSLLGWHAGIEVTTDLGQAPSTCDSVANIDNNNIDQPEGPPIATPLQSSVDKGVFGFDGIPPCPVNPSVEEIAELTDRLAFEMEEILLAKVSPRPMHDRELAGGAARLDAQYEYALQKYREDFGVPAAKDLDAYVRRRVATELADQQYGPGHPWHYYHEGDGAEPPPCESITPASRSFDLDRALPKDAAKRHAKLIQMLEQAEHSLADDKLRYVDLVERGAAALSDYDRRIAHGGNDDLAWASAIALKYNHISGGLARLATLKQMVEDIANESLF
jgi:hypothetical protein